MKSLGATPPNPQQSPDGQVRSHSNHTAWRPPLRDEGVAPSDLRLEIMRAHRNWALRFAPHLLEAWND